MRHARRDYDAIQPWPTKRPHYARTRNGMVGIVPDEALEDFDRAGDLNPIIPEDEPVFLIRGQDLAAIPAANAWCEAAELLGADPEIIATVRRHIDVVRQWQTDHAKVPDAPASALR